MRTVEGSQSAGGFRFALVVSKYHDFVTDRLQAGAVAALAAAGVRPDDVTVVRVPGAFELPFAARRAAASGAFDAIVCLGCLVRGATASGEIGVPITFGVLTTNSIEEALQRAADGPSNKGWEAAAAAVEMAIVSAALHPGVPSR
ncbi:MAG: 6,7-dimethyl-8-ribityllumazine synthase [Acidobacteria bacterium]|nr:MAG: 6,7-dimethyl-8-ribityllumazine synthase [Acidobacteriota bacterium]